MASYFARWARQANATLPWFPAAAAAANALVALNVSPVLPALQSELQLSSFQGGLLLAANMLTHTVVQIPGGRLVDSWGSRRCTALGLAVMGLCSLVVALAPSFELALLGRIAAGFGTGLAFLAGLILVGEMAGEGKGIITRGLYGAMFNFGTLIVLMASPPLAVALGWRTTFVVESGIVFALAIVGWYLVPDPPRRRQSGRAPWGVVLTQRHLYALGLAHTATYGVYMAVVSWTPTFLYQRYGASLALAGVLSGLLTIGGIAARLGGGWLGRGRESALIATCCVATAVLVAVFPLGLPLSVALLALFLLCGSAGLPFGPLFLRAGQVLGPQAAGASTGLVNFIANLGALFFPALVGYLLDTTHSYVWGFWVVAGLTGTGLAWAIPRLLSYRAADHPRFSTGGDDGEAGRNSRVVTGSERA